MLENLFGGFWQVLEADKRLGRPDTGGYETLKGHSFYKGINWDNLTNETPPKLVPFLPAKDKEASDLYGQYEVSQRIMWKADKVFPALVFEMADY